MEHSNLTRRGFLGAGAAAAAATVISRSASARSLAGPMVRTRRAAPVTITYFTFSAAPDHLKDLDAIIAAFNKQNPEITVKVATAAYADYFTSLQTQVAGNAAPDTFELNYENFVTYARSGALADLTPFTTSGVIDPKRYYPLALSGFQDGGKQFGLPATFSAVVLFYNKKLFDAAGLSYPTPEWTWKEETEAATKLTANGVFGDYQPVSFFEFYKSLAQAGGSFFGPDGKAAFNDDKGVAAATWLTTKPGTTMPTVADIGGTPDYDTNLFKSGKLAMWHNGIWQFAGLKDAGVDYDVVVEPGAEKKANAVFMNAAVVSAKSPNQEAAARWVAFLTGAKETVETRLASSWELPAVNDQAAFDSYLKITPPANRKAVFDALENIALPPVIERQSEMQDIVTKALESIVAGTAVKAALDGAVNDVNALIK